mgnify:CR=1 FL=1
MLRRNRRLYCLLKDAATCSEVVHVLVESGLSERLIHALAREGTDLEGIRKATQMQTTEIGHGLSVGLGIGGLAGMLGGLLALSFPPAGLVLTGGNVLFATTAAGAGFGSLVAVLLSSQVLHHSLNAYRKLILQGQILLILDIPTHRIAMTSDLIESISPSAEIGLADEENKG